MLARPNELDERSDLIDHVVRVLLDGDSGRGRVTLRYYPGGSAARARHTTEAQVPSPGQGHLAKDTHLLAQLETGPLSEVIDLLASRPSEV